MIQNMTNSENSMNTTTLNQSIPGRETAERTWLKNWTGERKEGRKEYSEGLRRFFVIVWPIKINGPEGGRKSDWSNSC